MFSCNSASLLLDIPVLNIPLQLDPPWYFVVVCPLTEGLAVIRRLAEEVARPIVL
jgi:hypothetical protein